MHQLLLYDVVPDYVERRAPYRAEHFALAQAAHERGELVLAGALADPVDGAVLVFRADSPSVAEEFARADPYVLNGLVTSWRGRAGAVGGGGDSLRPPLPLRSRPGAATEVLPP